MEKEILIKLVDFFLVNLEIEMVMRDKNEAVKRQDFETALNLRKKEKELLSQLTNIGEIKELRNKLVNETNS